MNALPVELQARILLHFGENPPQFHPFPRPLESIFEVQVVLQVVNKSESANHFLRIIMVILWTESENGLTADTSVIYH